MARTHDNMSYRDLQTYNRTLLTQRQLNIERKQKGLLNRGWQQVIDLYTWITQKLQTTSGQVEAKILSNFARMQQAAAAIKTTVHQVHQRSQHWQRTELVNNIYEFEAKDSSDDADGNLPATL